MPLIERRYAEALVDIAEKHGAIDAYQKELQFVADIYNQNGDFRFLLINPQIKVDEKKEIVKKIFSGSLMDNMINFLMLLIDRGRIRNLPGMLDEYIKLADERKNILSMTITSAAPLEEGQVNEIKDKYRKAYNALDVKVDIAVDESLVGGIKVQIGDKVIDGTVKGRLESLKELLLK